MTVKPLADIRDVDKDNPKIISDLPMGASSKHMKAYRLSLVNPSTMTGDIYSTNDEKLPEFLHAFQHLNLTLVFQHKHEYRNFPIIPAFNGLKYTHHPASSIGAVLRGDVNFDTTTAAIPGYHQ